jgi:hypothetical protein
VSPDGLSTPFSFNNGICLPNLETGLQQLQIEVAQNFAPPSTTSSAQGQQNNLTNNMTTAEHLKDGS